MRGIRNYRKSSPQSVLPGALLAREAPAPQRLCVSALALPPAPQALGCVRVMPPRPAAYFSWMPQRPNPSVCYAGPAHVTLGLNPKSLRIPIWICRHLPLKASALRPPAHPAATSLTFSQCLVLWAWSTLGPLPLLGPQPFSCAFLHLAPPSSLNLGVSSSRKPFLNPLG